MCGCVRALAHSTGAGTCSDADSWRANAAALSLQRLKLFQYYYVVVLIYIYLTQFLVYMLRETLPFQYVWVSRLLDEAFTLIFMIYAGWTFRPMGDNPYLRVPTSEAAAEEEEIMLHELHVDSQ